MRLRDLCGALSALSLLAACGGKDAGKGGAPPAKEEAHEAHRAPHGGEILELGEEEAHLEMVHDRSASALTVYVLDGDVKTPVAVEAPVVMLKTAEGVQEFSLTAVNPGPGGTADAWKGTHPGLATDPLEGRIRVVIRGKRYQSPLEGGAHDH